MTSLKEILANCKGGEVIDLGKQVIEPFYFSKVKFDEPVTLMGGVYAAPDGVERTFRMDSCQGLVFDGAEIFGTNRSADGLLFVGCKNITVKNSVFHGLKMALAHNRCDGFYVLNNRLYNIRLDGIRGGGSRDVQVIGNHGSDWFPVEMGGTGDHADFIQFWPTYDTDCDLIVIRDNHWARGDGAPAQGVFVRGVYRDKAGNLTRPLFPSLIVEDNTVEGGVYNGISVSGGLSGRVKNNKVFAVDGPSGGAGSFLRIGEFAGEVSGNVANKFVGDVPLDTNTQANIAISFPVNTLGLYKPDAGSSEADEAAAAAAAEAERLAAEEAARLEAEEAARLAAEAAERERLDAERAAADAARQAAEAAAAAAEAQRRAQEEAKAAEEAARQAAEEAARLKAEEEAARVQAEEEAARIKAEEALAAAAEAERLLAEANAAAAAAAAAEAERLVAEAEIARLAAEAQAEAEADRLEAERAAAEAAAAEAAQQPTTSSTPVVVTLTAGQTLIVRGE